MDQQESFGYLQVNTVTDNGFTPVENATIEVSTLNTPDNPFERVQTDNSGISPEITLAAPAIAYSMTPSETQPYSEYNLKITAPGYDEIFISGVQIMPSELSLQTIKLTKTLSPQSSIPAQDYTDTPVVIGGNTLWEYYPPKIAEPEIKPLNESGEIVLRRVVVPETIVVHDGVPSDSTAKDYYVPYLDYIKNVACCEIYSTWPTATITANVLAIMSFTLNRVYTEWYRNKGYNFTITSSTAYDHKWIYGQTIFKSISDIVDSLYNSYLARPNVKQPILTQYCDGKRVSCPNWMSQWGSKSLGDDGLSASQILRYYYGNDIYINTAEFVSGIPSSYPGYNLSNGSTGTPVKQIQEQLIRIRKNYPAIPNLTADGIYGPKTANAVSSFQKIFNLPVSGIVDFPTWYKISQIYVGVSKIAENV